jgi:hypothetical protein
MRPSAMVLTVCAALGFGVASAHATPCGDEIARLERANNQAASNPAVGPTERQSVGAQLGHQPTPETVKRAEAASEQSFAATLNRAKAFDAQGKAAECMEAVAAAKLKLE